MAQSKVVTKKDIEAIYPLSPMQQGLLFHALYAPESTEYFVQAVFRIHGELQSPALQDAWKQIIQRHSIFRTAFLWENLKTPVQVARLDARLPWKEEDWRTVPEHQQDEKLENFLEADRNHGFQLAKPPLMRLHLFQFAEKDFRLVWGFHHLLLDGWSVFLLLKELFLLYEASINGNRVNLESVRPYRDYIAYLQQEDPSASENFWRQTLKGFTAPTKISHDHISESSVHDAKTYGEREIRFSKDETIRLQAAAKQNGLTVNTFLQGAWALLLSRYSREKDVVFGATMSTRPPGLDRVESMVGLFINTLPARVKVEPEASVQSWLRKIQQQQAEARQHENVSLAQVQGWSEVPRGMQLFESILAFENYPANNSYQETKTSFEIREIRFLERTNYPLTVVVLPGAEFTLRIIYNSSRFSNEQIERRLGHLQTILHSFVENPEQRVSNVEILTKAEREHLLKLNQKIPEFAKNRCLHQIFESQVERTPDAIALVFEGQQLTYRELNERANQVAHYLRKNGVGPEVLVGICVERSAELVIGLLGILKAGGAYLPIDLAYPADRISFMLSDAGAPIVLTQQELLNRLPSSGTKSICLDSDWPQIARENSENLNVNVQPDNLIYVIYTSGSTGKPKGVPVTHANVARLFTATDEWFHFNDRDVWTLFHSHAFDFSVWELWGALNYGGKLIVVPYLVSRSPEEFYELLCRERVTVLNQTPSAFLQLIRAEESLGQSPDLSLRYVIFGGEALDLQSLRPWFLRHGDESPRLINMYGITETTVHVTYRPIRMKDVEGGAGSVIGAPIPDLQVYVLDECLSPVPLGIPGEMFVGGDGVARGYLRRPELSTQRFIANPFNHHPGARLYRTGDLARYISQDEIEYLGRIDHQVKIRGFRIELGEIEEALSHHPDVKANTVIVREDVPGDKRLVAYVVNRAGKELSSSDLTNFLKIILPEYMVPSVFVFLESFPLTASGKLDHKALPVPQQERPELADRYVAPRNSSEEVLAAIWTEVLRVPRVGIHDNFFQLGGDSILSIHVIARARKAGLHLTPRHLFKNPTIAELANLSATPQIKTAQQGLIEGNVLLTPIQHWFFEQNLHNVHHFNQALILKTKERLDPALLEKAIDQLAAHHDALRLEFHQSARGWEQKYSSTSKVLFRKVFLSGDQTTEKIVSEAQRSLNIESGPLAQFVYVDAGSIEDQRLVAAIHHLAIDAVSWQILLEDLETIYLQLADNQPIRLAAKTTSFQEWAQRLKDYASTQRGEWNYWTKMPTSQQIIPRDHQRGSNLEASTDEVSITLSSEETRAILQEIPSLYKTEINDVLLTSVGKALTEWISTNSLLIDLEAHGREEIFDDVDLSRTIGWFTTIFPVELKFDPNESPGRTLKAIKNQLREIPNRGLGYGVLRYLSNIPDRTKLPQSEIVFNYLGQMDHLLSNSSLLASSKESVGPSHDLQNLRRHVLEIISWIENASLRINFRFSENLHQKQTIQRIAERALQNLRSILIEARSKEFAELTPSDFPLAKVGQQMLDQLAKEGREIEDIYPLTPMQQLFYTLDSADPSLGFLQLQYTLQGVLNVPAFKKAWGQVVTRHSMLRTVFRSEGFKQPHQIVYKSVSANWTEKDLRHLSSSEQLQQIQLFRKSDAEVGFDISQPPLTRLALFRTGDTTYQFVWSHHHLQIDGWSWPLVFREISHLYSALINGRDPGLSSAIPYKDYVSWLMHHDESESESFWRKKLHGLSRPTNLMPEQLQERNVIEEKFQLSSESTAQLQHLIRQHQLTMNTLIRGVWGLLLSHHSGESDVLFGASFSGRPTELRGVDSMVGSCVNNIPVRARISPSTPLLSWLEQLQDEQLELTQYQYSSLMKIQEWSEIPWRYRLFESLLVFQNYLVEESSFELEGSVKIQNIEAALKTNYPLTLMVIPAPELELMMVYQRSHASAATSLWSNLKILLQEIASDPNRLLSEFVAKLPLTSYKGTRYDERVGKVAASSAPQTEMEQKIAAIWQDYFHVPVGIHDNFFDLGGHSILMVQVHNKLQQSLNTDLSIVKMFQYPTVSSLAKFLTDANEKDSYGEIYDRAQRQRKALTRQRKVVRR